METEDIRYMRRAMALAERGQGWVNPNPLVGAVIVKDGRVIAEGWHERYGGWHAERNAFRNCAGDPAGATLYVTLEPCCHYGKTPPCTEAVINHRIRRVVVGLTDPNPLVAGKGMAQLREAGIEVVSGIAEEELREQNRVFLKYITTGLPWVVMKTAMTLDGKIATHTGDSKWVTGEAARQKVQEMRARYKGIMAGIGTVEADDPLLNCRLEGEVRQPVRIVVDSRARISPESRLVRTVREVPLILAHTSLADPEKITLLRGLGADPLECKQSQGRVDIPDLLRQLGRKGIDGILLEGGGELNESFLRAGAVDEVYAFIAPRLIGGREARTPVEGCGLSRMSEAILLQDVSVTTMGGDILIHGKIPQHSNTLTL